MATDPERARAALALTFYRFGSDPQNLPDLDDQAGSWNGAPRKIGEVRAINALAPPFLRNSGGAYRWEPVRTLGEILDSMTYRQYATMCYRHLEAVAAPVGLDFDAAAARAHEFSASLSDEASREVF
jgi:hypothetical protein